MKTKLLVKYKDFVTYSGSTKYFLNKKIYMLKINGDGSYFKSFLFLSATCFHFDYTNVILLISENKRRAAVIVVTMYNCFFCGG